MSLRAVLGKVDRIPESVLLWINVALAGFVALAHGGALAITYLQSVPEAGDIRQIASISLPIAAVVILTGVAALVRANYRRAALAIHGVLLGVSAIAILLWALSLVAGGIPYANFAWSPGLMTAWVCYSVFVASRYSVPGRLRTRDSAFYAPLFTLVIAASVDVGVLMRFIGEMGRRLG
jgi:hypothetical protein